jgi:hypothetical protein
MAVRRVIGEWPRRLNHRYDRRQITSLSSHFFSTDSGDGGDTPRVKIFDRDLKRKHRDRAAWLTSGSDQLLDSVADNLLDRLQVLYRRYVLKKIQLLIIYKGPSRLKQSHSAVFEMVRL